MSFELLNNAADAYYNTGTPIMSDAEFDALEHQMRGIDPSNAYFLKVGSDVRGDKVVLPFPLGSLDQVHAGEFEKWCNTVNLKSTEMAITDKLDGMSIFVVYDYVGNLKIALTRGDGYVGKDITRHIRKMHIPQKATPNLKVRGEIIIPIDKFNEANSSGKLGREFQNARNYSAGQINKEVCDAIFVEICDVVVYEVIDDMDKSKQIDLLKSNNFITPAITMMAGGNITDEKLAGLLATAKDTSPYELDGIVIDVNSVVDRNAIPLRESSSINPVYAKKFKINGAAVETQVVAVHWNISKHGYLKPRVEFEPVQLSGVTITFASGFNAKFIKEHGIGPGAVVRITRSGDVIPYIESVATPATPLLPDATTVGAMHWSENDIDLILDDDHDDATIQQMISFFTSIEVPKLKSGNIEKLFNGGFTSIESVINASYDDICNIIGEAVGQEIYLGITTCLNPIDEWKFAGSTNLFGRGIGKRRLKKLVDAHGTIHVDLKTITSTQGFDTITATQIIDGMQAYNAFVSNVSHNITFSELTAPVTGSLSGEVICFTGVRDKDLQTRIEQDGGVVSSSVNKNTTMVVAKDPTGTSSKLKKATTFGIPILSIGDAPSVLWP